MGNVQTQERKDISSYNNFYGKSDWCLELTTPNLTVLMSSDLKCVIVAYQINATDVIELRATGVEAKVAKEIVKFGKSLYCFSTLNKVNTTEKPTCTLFLNDSNGCTHHGGYVELSLTRHSDKECDQNFNTVTTDKSENVSLINENLPHGDAVDTLSKIRSNSGGEKIGISKQETNVKNIVTAKADKAYELSRIYEESTHLYTSNTTTEECGIAQERNRVEPDVKAKSFKLESPRISKIHKPQNVTTIPHKRQAAVSSVMLSPFLYNRRDVLSDPTNLKRKNVRGETAFYSLTNWLGVSTSSQQNHIANDNSEVKQLQTFLETKNVKDTIVEDTSDTDTDRTLTPSNEFEYTDTNATIRQCIAKLKDDDCETHRPTRTTPSSKDMRPSTQTQFQDHEKGSTDTETEHHNKETCEKQGKDPRTETWLAFVSSLKYEKPISCTKEDLIKFENANRNTDSNIYSCSDEKT